MITFLTPWFLVGLLAAAIPLIIHLSRSRRTKKMRFSTTRFFTDQFLRSYRMSRLKELLLLACRMALCGFLAMALARPLLLPKGQTFLMRGSRSVVLVIDNSASMGYVEDGKTLLDRARDSAREVVEGLRPGDTASVVLAGRRAAGAEVLYPEPTDKLDEVLQTVNGLTVAPLGTDLSGAVARAETIAQAGRGASKEVYVLSDLQDSGWELQTQDTAQTSSDVLFFFVKVRPKSVANVAVTALQYAAARPMVGVPFAIRPHLAVQGDQPGSCRVSLFVDGQKVGERQVEKGRSGRWAIPRFYHTFTTGGWHSGYVEVQDDALPADNRRYFVFEVLDSVKVLAVNGAPSQVPRLDELFFLKAALGAANPDGKSHIQVDVVGVPDVASADVSKYPLVMVANAETLPAPAVEKLEGYADQGGSVLFFLGDKVNATAYNQNLAGTTRLHGGLLPGRLISVEGNPAAEDGFAFVGDVDYDHTALAAFQEPKFANLTGVSFKALWKVDPGAAAVLMRTNNGLPLLCEKAFGKGRVMLFTSTCDRDWTNFPVRPAYLPWVHRLVGYLAQEPLGRQAFYATGDRLGLPIAASEGLPQVLVKKPDGTTGYPTTGDDPEQPLVFGDTAQQGIYTLLLDKKENGQLFAVNLDSYESDLTYLDDVLADRDDERQYTSREDKVQAGLRELLPGRPAELITYVDDPATLGDASLGARRGVKLWDYVLAIVLIIALFEPWLANRISARLYARPREVAGGTPLPTAGRALPEPAKEVASR